MKRKVFLCGQWRWIRYPRTDKGRERYIRESLNSDGPPDGPKRILRKVIFLLIGVTGGSGLLGVLFILCIKTSIDVPLFGWLLLIIFVSMVLLAVGVCSFDKEIRRGK